ncbi:hypothetical protein H9P43_001834 [Blastocladiella emersonii ATCC 22665]|nr:hypothetical protein H9P43_001834 [Blastocladiella emersonii ATCC 22665]
MMATAAPTPTDASEAPTTSRAATPPASVAPAPAPETAADPFSMHEVEQLVRELEYLHQHLESVASAPPPANPAEHDALPAEWATAPLTSTSAAHDLGDVHIHTVARAAGNLEAHVLAMEDELRDGRVVQVILAPAAEEAGVVGGERLVFTAIPLPTEDLAAAADDEKEEVKTRRCRVFQAKAGPGQRVAHRWARDVGVDEVMDRIRETLVLHAFAEEGVVAEADARATTAESGSVRNKLSKWWQRRASAASVFAAQTPASQAGLDDAHKGTEAADAAAWVLQQWRSAKPRDASLHLRAEDAMQASALYTSDISSPVDPEDVRKLLTSIVQRNNGSTGPSAGPNVVGAVGTAALGTFVFALATELKDATPGRTQYDKAEAIAAKTAIGGVGGFTAMHGDALAGSLWGPTLTKFSPLLEASGVATVTTGLMMLHDLSLLHRGKITVIEFRKRSATALGGTAGGVVAAAATTAATLALVSNPAGWVLLAAGVVGGLAGGVVGGYGAAKLDSAIWDATEDANEHAHRFFGLPYTRGTRPARRDSPKTLGAAYAAKLALHPKDAAWPSVCKAQILAVVRAQYPDEMELLIGQAQQLAEDPTTSRVDLFLAFQALAGEARRRAQDAVKVVSDATAKVASPPETKA